MRRDCSLPGVRTGRDDVCITGRGAVFCCLVMSFLASLAGGLTILRHTGAAALADASCCADHPARCSPCGGRGWRVKDGSFPDTTRERTSRVARALFIDEDSPPQGRGAPGGIHG